MTEGYKVLIGPELLSIEGDSGLRFADYYKPFSPFHVIDGTPRWRVLFDQPVHFDDNQLPLRSSCQLFDSGIDCRFFSGEELCLFDMSKEGKIILQMEYQRGGEVVNCSSCDNFDAIRFAMWVACSMLTASSRITFVHSSVIVHQRRAVLFLGESGTGKSTHTRLWLKNIPDAHLLNDDSPLISLSQKSQPTLVYGTPWSGKTNCYHNRWFPLAAVVRLSQAPQNAIRRLSSIDAFGALQPSLPPMLMQDEWFSDLFIDMLSDIILQVPFYHLACLPDDNSARLSHDTIFPTR